MKPIKVVLEYLREEVGLTTDQALKFISDCIKINS